MTVDSLDPLVQRAQRGDRRAFGELLQRHDAQMRGVAFSVLGSRAAMDDALQDAYLRAHRNLASFRGDAAFGTWLHRIVRNTCIDHARRTSRRVEAPLPDDTGAHAAIPQAHRPMDDRVTDRLAVRAALARLRPEHREVLVLVDADGVDYEEAAARLGIPVGTLSSRLTRARTHLRTLLANGDDTSHDPFRPGGAR